MILNISNEAAEYRTDIAGWVSRNGRFFGNDERAARYDGCTHVECSECGAPTEKNRTVCTKCRRSREQKRFAELKRQEWDEETPLCIYNDDVYFFSRDELEYYCEEMEISISDLPLVLCRPQYFTPIDPIDYYYDTLPEEGDLPIDIEEAFDNLNAIIQKSKSIASWIPSNVAAVVL